MDCPSSTRSRGLLPGSTRRPHNMLACRSQQLVNRRARALQAAQAAEPFPVASPQLPSQPSLEPVSIDGRRYAPAIVASEMYTQNNWNKT